MSLLATVGPRVLITGTFMGPHLVSLNDSAIAAQTIAFIFLFICFATTLFVNPVLSLIPGIAAFAYSRMLQDKESTEFYRYADWILTTPLMLLLLLTASKVPDLKIAGLIATNSVMIWAGYKGVKSKDRDERRKWFVLGCLAFIPILWTLSALKPSMAITLTLIVWTLYPIVWLASEESLITSRTTTIAYAGMDTVAKVGLVYLLG